MNKYDKRHIANVRRYQRQVDAIYKEAVEQAALRAAGLPVPEDYIFTFDDFPALKMQIDALMSSMQADLELTITNGIRAEWDLANAKNDALVSSALGQAAGLARYHRMHEDALSAFLARKERGLNLSDRVWQYTKQFKGELEMGLDIGIREGMDAASIARQLKQYLQFPDMLFRRVRDEHGVLHLSKRAAEFHPGQGVYRSSYKNARRLAATETNIAYRTSDHERWKDLDFIVGIEVHLSNNHTCLNSKGKPEPFFDICDELQGKYPKEFKFTGWHPHCRCIATPILKTKEELDADDERIKRGEEPIDPNDSENAVKELPDQFKTWMDDNAERIENAKSTPYFLADNEALISGTNTAAEDSLLEDWGAFGKAKEAKENGEDLSEWVDEVFDNWDGATSEIFAHDYVKSDWETLVNDFLQQYMTEQEMNASKGVLGGDDPIEDYILKHGREKTVPVIDLKPTQGWVGEAFQYITYKDQGVKGAIPLIHIEGTERYYVVNGHHRAINQILWGHEDIQARVIEAPHSLMDKLSPLDRIEREQLKRRRR